MKAFFLILVVHLHLIFCDRVRLNITSTAASTEEDPRYMNSSAPVVNERYWNATNTSSYDNSCYVSKKYQKDAWWYGDLEYKQKVSTVRILNRDFDLGYQMQDVEVYIVDTFWPEGVSRRDEFCASTEGMEVKPGKWITLNCISAGTNGDRVMLKKIETNKRWALGFCGI